MANLGFDFNAENIEPSTPYEALPKGKYTAIATASEMKPTKNGLGEYLQITFEVVEGEHKGRKVFERLNIKNANRQAEDIAQRQLSALCRAVGVMRPRDSEELHDKEVGIELVIEEGDGKYSAQNRIKSYFQVGSTPTQAPAPRAATPAPAPQPAQQTLQPVASNKPAWKR